MFASRRPGQVLEHQLIDNATPSQAEIERANAVSVIEIATGELSELADKVGLEPLSRLLAFVKSEAEYTRARMRGYFPPES